MFFLLTAASYGATLHVGPGQPYAAPCAAIAAAKAGDLILIDATGSYNGDTCRWYTNSLTLRGINGRPHIDAAGKTFNGQGIWVINGTNTVVENMEFSGASSPGANGSGIWLAAPGLTVRGCYFHNNQNGILTGNFQTGEVLVEFSEFGFNGAGDGNSHNLYVGQIAKFTMQFSYSHDANQGQLVKTRAAENHIQYNRLSSESSPTSYELDIPNGGLSFVIGNIIQQGPNDPNRTLLEYLAEGATAFNADHRLFVVNNTFVNNCAGGTFVWISSIDATPATIRNNILAGPGTVTTQASATQADNISGVDPLFAAPSTYDYHLLAGSPAINAGAASGTAAGQPLDPVYAYVHSSCGQARRAVGAIDAGAYEYGYAGAAINCTVSATAPAVPVLAAFSAPANVRGGVSVTGTVTLSGDANAGGTVVSLASTNAALAGLPSTITLPAGAPSASFLITTGGVAAVTPVTLTASDAGVAKAPTVYVYPWLAISAVAAQNVTATGVTLTWSTNNPATSSTQYGLTSSYGLSSAVNSTRVTAHSVSLTGLTPATVYHFRVTGTDATGTTVCSADYTFTTPALIAAAGATLPGTDLRHRAVIPKTS